MTEDKLEYLTLFLADIKGRDNSPVNYTYEDIEKVFLYGYNLCLSEIENKVKSL